MPTEAKFLGVYGAVWLAILLMAASAVFARRMLQLLRVLALGQKENRLNNLPLRAVTFVKEVIFQSRFLKGEPIIKWAHPLIFWGFCFFVIASALLFVGGVLAPWLRIPQAEAIPVLGTVIDLFAVAVLVGLVASSIRRYVFTPPGLQRTLDATIVVGLIAALMVTYLMAEAGGYVKERAERNATTAATLLLHQDANGGLYWPSSGMPATLPKGEGTHRWGQTWLPAGTALAKTLSAAGVQDTTLVSMGVGAWWAHALILLFFLVYLPYSKHMHLMWAPFAVFFAELPVKGTLPPVVEKGDKEPATPLGQFTWRMLLQRLCLRRVRPLRARLPGGGQRLETLAPADHPRPEGVRPRRGPLCAAPRGRATGTVPFFWRPCFAGCFATKIGTVPQRPPRVHRRRDPGGDHLGLHNLLCLR